ncbi:terminase [Nocardioides sp. OK12]|uniref:hypothetical protein n=1 Tax=Nocardioides sp. OK12 TaxID=2758661 RepID=UPI0021C4098D|nr:hypothetical protein [Nocardioides sp. OK12]GHJ59143.1 terminase [Nocardioides sp. OK12]
MARSRTAAQASAADSEHAEIVAWYEDHLANVAPPSELVWEPVKIGPTWQWDNGWLLPDLTLGWNVLSWCGVWLRDKHGQPWQFTAEQARFILWYYALDEHGDFVYHSGVLQRLKGWGKDPVVACLSPAECFADVRFSHFENGRPIGREEPNAWVQIVAVSQEQTKNTFKLFPSLISPEARQQYGIQIGKLNVYGLGDTRQIEAVTSNPLSIEGGRPTFTGRAETQNWNASNGGHDMAGAMEGNAAKSEGGAARMLDFCNAYRPGEDSVGERMREAWEATQGVGEDKPTAMDFGLLYDSLEAPPDAPLTADAAPAVVESIRGDSYWLDTRPRGRIVKSILNPANPPSESRRKWYNQITATEDAWLTPQEFDGLKVDRIVEPGERVFLFFDGSKTDDASALVGCCESDGHVFTVRVWQRPPRSDGWIVDRADVDRVVRDSCELWTVVGLWADPSDARDDETGERFWESYLDDWARDYGETLELWAQKTGEKRHAVIWDMRYPRHQETFVEHAERFVSDVKAGTLTHDGAERLKQHVKNARRRPNKYGVSLGKEHRESSRKVDAAICAVGARMMWRLAKAQPAQEQHDGGWWA